ncbi:cytochrome C biogenesis protein CcdA [Brevirhabdus pacifica]|uniref:Cytochrome C biogenesis protein CcdA n=1 Tax=Brevirhabdus pacifica TaxID=1267768 RepID=A0A1U7DHM1_9RHOB|nr:cytochrome c biogenesis CcdA family protein [Brevirhabdus pacifica]APX89425.1 cytochrome C biogenesis protein CcdA [Brevirhabdus pacifica]OWU76553.1 sulfur oxidation protein [Loktanella sp. 22II-4b]PJJ85932.1 cytochrome c-type biogenesis protein [Brevirhabdus pacifica]
MLEISFGGAALAGLLSFLSPCVLPMVPFYLSYLAGISMSELREDGGIAPGAQRRLVISSLFFALGVTTIFVLLGLGASTAGQFVRAWDRELSWIAAAVLFVFGLHFIGVIRIPILYREARFNGTAEPKGLVGAYVMGLAFGFGWTPCVGPALTAILVLASGLDVAQGGLLLLVYGLSMTLPFVLAALLAKPFLRMVQRHRRYLKYVEVAMGVMLIIFAVLLATNSVNYIGAQMLEWFPGFTQIG